MFVDTCVGKSHIVVKGLALLEPLAVFIETAVFAGLSLGKINNLGHVVRDVAAELPFEVAGADHMTRECQLETLVADGTHVAIVTAGTCRFRH